MSNKLVLFCSNFKIPYTIIVNTKGSILLNPFIHINIINFVNVVNVYNSSKLHLTINCLFEFIEIKKY